MNNMAVKPIIQNSTLTDENGVTALSVATGGAVTLNMDVTNLSDAAATKLGLKQYRHGTNYNGGNAPTLSSAQGGFSVNHSSLIPYQMQDGGWRMRFNISVGITSAAISQIIVAVNGIVAKSGATYQTGSAACNITVSYPRVLVGGNANEITLNWPAAVTTSYISIIGDIELESKPTWAY